MNINFHKLIFLIISALVLPVSLWAGSLFPAPAAPPEAEPEPIVEEETEERATITEWTPREPGTQTNILLLGLDNGGLCDAIMIFSYNTETNQSALIALKRDTYVSDQTWAEGLSGYSQIAFAHYFGMGTEKDYDQGAVYTLLWIEHLLSIPLHGYASITFDGFSGLIDRIGGVEVYIAPAFASKENNPIPSGMQLLSGEQALSYARHRSEPRIPEQGSVSEDGDRARRNQRLLQAIAARCKELDPEELVSIYQELGKSIHTSLDDWDLLSMANSYYHTNPADLMMFILPGEAVEMEEEGLDGATHYYILDPDKTDNILKGLGLKN
jgi:LCP family protein required for cell wall assembly